MSTDLDEFDKAFDSISDTVEPTADEEAEPREEMADAEVVDEQPAPVDETPSEPADETPPEETPEPQAEPDYRQLYNTLRGKYDAEVPRLHDELKELRRTREQPTEKPAAPTPAPEPENSGFKEMLNDMPELADALDKELARRTKEVEERLRGEFGNVTQRIEPVVKEIQVERFMTAVRAEHPDVDKIIPDIKAWIDTQPSYLRDTYTAVYQSGSIEQTVDLIGRFKRERQPTQPPAAPNTKAVVDASAVRSRSAPRVASAALDPDDFDAAFDRITRG